VRISLGAPSQSVVRTYGIFPLMCSRDIFEASSSLGEMVRLCYDD